MATTSAPHESLYPNGGRPDGAAAAWTEALYAQYGRTIGGLCRALLGDAAEAEDAAQQTFLSAHRALLNGSTPREPAAWLATIARNECWARIKTRMREPLPSDTLEARAPDAADPVTEALRRADLAALWSAIDALPPVQRNALLLREFGGLSYEELAAALAVSGPAVESLLFRARRRLRVQLRTAFAAFTGASWLEALARLLAGGGAPAAAAKVAALGVGAAALGSGAVVVPQVFENHHPSQPAPRQAHVHDARPAYVEQVTPPPRTVVPVVAKTPVQTERHSERRAVSLPPERSHEDVRSVADRSGPGSSGDGSRRDGGDGSVATTVEVTTTLLAPAATATTDDHGSDGGKGSDGGGGDGGGDGGH